MPCPIEDSMLSTVTTGTVTCSGNTSASIGTAMAPPPKPAPPRTANASKMTNALNNICSSPGNSITPPCAAHDGRQTTPEI